MADVHQETETKVWIGVVAEDKGTDDVTLKVILPNITPSQLHGTVGAGVTDMSIASTNAAGVTQNTSIRTANHIIAEWEGMSNIAYPPMKAKGEQVIITKYGDTDKFYWRSLGRDHELRKQDRFRCFVSAVTSNSVLKDDTNTYFFELDAINGTVQLRTCKGAGNEPFSYALTFNTKTGTFIITDDDSTGDAGVPNRILLDSKNKQIQVNTSGGAVTILQDKNILHSAPQDLVMKAGRQLVFDSPITTFNQAGSGVLVFNGAHMGFNLSGSYVINAATIGLNGTVKASGVLVAGGGIRSPQFTYGPLNGTYTAVMSDINRATATPPSNTADTDVSGGGDRNAAAWDQVDPAFQATAAAIKALAQAIPTSVNTDGITTNSSASKMETVKGK